MPPEWMDWQGRTIDHKFELRQYLGESDHSVVFLTTLDAGLAQKAAIKLIPANPGETDLKLSLHTSVKKLSHPNIVSLFSAGECFLEERRCLYVAMEYADENLATILSSRPLTATETLQMLDPLLDALAYLHAEGYVHGRIKPSNIMAVNEQLKISSDGIMQAGQVNEDLANPSPNVPPEAVTGRLSNSADAWSVGMIVVEALTQRRFVFVSDEQTEAELCALPSPFRDVATECLRADPEQRCTIDKIRSALHSPHLLINSPTSDHSKISIKRSRVLSPLTITVLLSMILAGVLVFRHRSYTAMNSISAKRSQTSSRLDPSADTSGDPNSVAPGRVVRQVSPDVSRTSLQTIHGTVRVKIRVHVDSTGKVEKVEALSAGASKYFANKASEAAKKWTFAAPVSNGRSVSSQWNLEFNFRRTTTDTRAVQVPTAES